jgi:tripartite-type tricarboxylate transporter receptor subunit TctC
LPTFAEAGYPIDAGSLRGVGGPRGMPEDVIRKLTAGIERVVQNPEFRETAKKTFQPLRFVPTAEYKATLQAADKQFRELWKVEPWNQ